MNKNRYLFLRAVHFVSGLVPSFLSLFFPRDKKTIIFNSQFNTTFEHNSRALFLYFLASKSNGIAKFVINDSEKRRALREKYGDHFITNDRFKDIIMIMRSGLWVCSSLETPLSGFGLSFRRTVIHLGHGAPIKSVGLGEKYVSLVKSIYYRLIRTNFSYLMSSSAAFDSAWAKCLHLPSSHIVRCPQARCDQVVSPDRHLVSLILDKSSYNVLYAPTWRPFSDTQIFPFDDFNLDTLCDGLEKKGVTLFLRLHPNFEFELDEKLLKCERIKLLSSQDISDINPVLGGFDLVITDYSSIYIDFLLTEKPVMFLPYDYNEYESTIGFSIDYEKLTPGPKPNSLVAFLSELETLLTDSDYYLSCRKNANKVLNPIMRDHAKHTLNVVKTLAKR
ncbi:CDP-glycerol glycerophosphotransferase family protein [Salinivibrio costicola]|uniref:CDP-glycerol glycerophosphotransferase family protein n=1 Tax=Salinivibrio costicola TaxID=51367 RepID=UPI003F70FB3C